MNKKLEKFLIGIFLGIPSLFLVIFLKTPAIFILLSIFGILAVLELKNNIGPNINKEFGSRNYVFFSSFLIGIPFLFAVYISHHFGYQWVLFIGFNAYLTDTGGWLFGALLKKNYKAHIMAQDISENKSWEGAIFGIILTNLICTLIVFQFMPPTLTASRFTAFRISFFGSIGAILGDLIESKIKRMAGVKDSSSTLKSHGGFLDKIDSLLGTLYVYIFWFALEYIKRGI